MMRKFILVLILCASVFSLCAFAEIIPEKATLTYDKYDLNEDGVFDDMVYELSTKEQLYWFANAVNNGQGHINAILVNDIAVNENLLSRLSVSDDLTAVLKEGETAESWLCTGTFGGIFDGRGHTISGLYFNGTAENKNGSGFFSSVTSAVVRNLNVADSYFSAVGYPVGGIAGKASKAVIENCTFDGISRISETAVAGGICGETSSGSIVRYCKNYGDVFGYGNVHNPVGGICGRNGSASLVTCCSNDGAVSGRGNETYVGGIVGFNYGTIDYCYNTGTTSSNGICTVHFQGVVNNSYNVGVAKLGIGGYTTIDDENGYVTNCYWLNSVSNAGYRGDPAGVSEGKSEEYMKSSAFLEKLSAGSTGIWQQKEGEYPTLVPMEMSRLSVNENATSDTTGHIYSVSSGGIVFASDEAGATFIVVYSDYDGNKQNSVMFYTAVARDAATKYAAPMNSSLSTGDKIIIIKSTSSMTPVCKEYTIE